VRLVGIIRTRGVSPVRPLPTRALPLGRGGFWGYAGCVRNECARTLPASAEAGLRYVDGEDLA
jgi:hypothetical protein